MIQSRKQSSDQNENFLISGINNKNNFDRDLIILDENNSNARKVDQIMNRMLRGQLDDVIKYLTQQQVHNLY